MAEISEKMEEYIAYLPEEKRNHCKSLIHEVVLNQNDILAQGKQGDQIIKSILQQARMGSLPRTPENINQLVQEALVQMEKALNFPKRPEAPQISLHLDTKLPELPLSRGEIIQVLLNLFMNAAYSLQKKAVSQGKIFHPQLTITTTSENDHITLSVQDNGLGLTESEKKQLFQPFFTTKPLGQGTGLGLAICKEILQGHGGGITATGEPGQGAEFTLWIPVAPAGHPE